MISVFFRHESLPAAKYPIRLPTLPRKGEVVYLDDVSYVAYEVNHIVYSDLMLCEENNIEPYWVVVQLLTVKEHEKLVRGKG